MFTDACEMGYRMHTDWLVARPAAVLLSVQLHHAGLGLPGRDRCGRGAGRPAGGLASAATAAFVMTAQELATAVRYRLRVIAIVHNDSTYGAIKNIQERAHEGRYLDVELNNPDFLQLAAAYGVPGRRARGPDEFHAAVRRSTRSRRPVADRGPRPVAVPARPGQRGPVSARFLDQSQRAWADKLALPDRVVS